MQNTPPSRAQLPGIILIIRWRKSWKKQQEGANRQYFPYNQLAFVVSSTVDTETSQVSAGSPAIRCIMFVCWHLQHLWICVRLYGQVKSLWKCVEDIWRSPKHSRLGMFISALCVDDAAAYLPTWYACSASRCCGKTGKTLSACLLREPA